MAVRGSAARGSAWPGPAVPGSVGLGNAWQGLPLVDPVAAVLTIPAGRGWVCRGVAWRVLAGHGPPMKQFIGGSS